MVLRPRTWKMGRVLRSSEQEVPPPLLPSDLRPILRSRRSKMGGFFDLRGRRSKVEDRGGSSILRLERSKMWGGSPIFWFRRSKNPPPYTIFGAEDRRTPHLQSSTFGPEDRRVPPPSTIFGPEEWVEDRTEDGEGGWDFFEDGGLLRRWEGVLRSSVSEDRRTPSHLRSSGPEERRTPPSFTFSVGRL